MRPLKVLDNAQGKADRRGPGLGGGARTGQALVEYALILCFVALVCVAALSLFGGAVRDLYLPAAAAI